MTVFGFIESSVEGVELSRLTAASRQFPPPTMKTLPLLQWADSVVDFEMAI
jgi:hypothetical protein